LKSNQFWKIFLRRKLLYSVVFQNRFMQMRLKQVFQVCSQNRKIETLGLSIIKVNQGKIIMNETVKKI
jgi:deoxyadenosine/deoxycytidine kinase